MGLWVAFFFGGALGAILGHAMGRRAGARVRAFNPPPMLQRPAASPSLAPDAPGADDVLNALLANDTNIDEEPPARRLTSPEPGVEILDPEVDTETGSSIFAPFLTGKPKKQTAGAKRQAARAGYRKGVREMGL